MKKLPLLGIFITALFLVVVWFRDGLLLGTGESGLPFYNLRFQHRGISQAWADPALGVATGINVVSAPTYWVLGKLQQAGLPGYLLQALFFGLLFVVSGVSVYFLTKELFPKVQSRYLLLASFFYWFNPVSLVVWNRFLYNYMVFWAFLPLALLLFLKGIRKKDYRLAVVASLSTAVFSYALTSVVFVILLWFLFFYIFLFFLIIGKKQRLFLVKYFILTLLSFVLFNFWWINQLFNVILSPSFSRGISTNFTTQGNLNTLTALSRQLGQLVGLTRLMPLTFFTNGPDWASIYLFIISTLLEFLVAGFVFWTTLKFKRNHSVILMGGLFTISLFLAKGNNPPLGEIFEWFFTKFTVLQVFRNPFEKFGFLLPLSVAPLFAFGVSEFSKRLKSVKWKRGFISFSFLYVLVFLGFPFWTGFVFTSEAGRRQVESYQVKVPDYYRQANEWFKKQGDNFRFISLPLGGEGMTYTWEKPYSGVELSSILFEVPNISFNTTIPFYKEIVEKLEGVFIKRRGLSVIMDALNVRYILVRTDIDWRIRGVRDPQTIKALLESNEEGIEKVADFGKLSIWENKAWSDKRFFVTDTLIKSVPYPQINDLITVNLGTPIVLYSDDDNDIIKGLVVHPRYRFYQETHPPLGFEERQDIFPHVRFLPSSPFYKLVILKENLERRFAQDDTYLAEMLLKLLGKRLNEVKKEAERGNWQGVSVALFSYEKILNEFKEIVVTLSKMNAENERQVWRQEDLYNIFSRHHHLLSEMEELAENDKLRDEIKKTRSFLSKTLASVGISPAFPYVYDEVFPLEKRVTFQFVVEKEGDYELLVDAGHWNQFYKNDFSTPILFQVDNDLMTARGSLDKSGLISFGKLHLSEGVHEIGFNTPPQRNLVKVPQELSISVDHGTKEIDFEIQPYDPAAKYEISFDYWIKKGSGVTFYFEANNDKIEDGEVSPSFSRSLGPDNYNFDFRNYSTVITPNLSSDSGKIGFRVESWNDCESIYWNRRKRCEDESFRRQYDKTTEVVIRGVSVKRKLTNDAVLRYVESSRSRGSLPEVGYQKIDPTLYNVKVKGAENKFSLVFSELFDSGWKAIFEDGTKIPEDRHFLANGYANGWVIDKPGNYNLTIKFAPQDLLEKGEKISLASIFSAVVFLGVLSWRKRRQ